MEMTKESVWISENWSRIFASQHLEAGRIKVSYSHQPKNEEEPLHATSVDYHEPPCQMSRPYSSWWSLYPVFEPEDQSIMGRTSFLNGNCLGAMLTEEVAALPVDVQEGELAPYAGNPKVWILAKKGTLEDYLPFNEMDQLMNQVAVHYPEVEILTRWQQAREELAFAWKHVRIRAWIHRALEYELQEESQSEMDAFILSLIEGVPLEHLLLNIPGAKPR